MVVQKVLLVLLGVLAITFLGFQVFEIELEAAGIRMVLLLLLTLLYYCQREQQSKLFLSFLIFYSAAEILNFVSWILPAPADDDVDYLYYVINSLYITSYSLLITGSAVGMNLLHIVKKYYIHLIILILLDALSVVVVTNTVIDKLPFFAYNIEFVYNLVVMVLLNVALLRYIDSDNKSNFALLIGAIFIFFSEVIQLAYFYISPLNNLLNITCSLFFVLGLSFFYIHSVSKLHSENLGSLA